MQSLEFVEGYMPMQMLAEMAVLLGALIFISHCFEKKGVKINKLFQATGLQVLAMAYLKYRVYPPMPFSTFAMYTTTIAIGIFVWVSATEESWQDFRKPILAVLDGTTRSTRVIRMLVLVLLPILIGVIAFTMFKPVIYEPIELRVHYPAPPRSVTVHGKTFELVTAQNPFRVDEQGHYLPPPSDPRELTCMDELSAYRALGGCTDPNRTQ
jgi:hypothetical protein